MRGQGDRVINSGQEKKIEKDKIVESQSEIDRHLTLSKYQVKMSDDLGKSHNSQILPQSGETVLCVLLLLGLFICSPSQ